MTEGHPHKLFSFSCQWDTSPSCFRTLAVSVSVSERVRFSVVKKCNFKLFQWQWRTEYEVMRNDIAVITSCAPPSTIHTHTRTTTHTIGDMNTPPTSKYSLSAMWSYMMYSIDAAADVNAPWQWGRVSLLIESAKVSKCTRLCGSTRRHSSTSSSALSSHCYAASMGCLWNVHSHLWPSERQVTANLGQTPHTHLL